MTRSFVWGGYFQHAFILNWGYFLSWVSFLLVSMWWTVLTARTQEHFLCSGYCHIHIFYGTSSRSAGTAYFVLWYFTHQHEPSSQCRYSNYLRFAWYGFLFYIVILGIFSTCRIGFEGLIKDPANFSHRIKSHAWQPASRVGQHGRHRDHGDGDCGGPGLSPSLLGCYTQIKERTVNQHFSGFFKPQNSSLL